jgi:hypothetical protein
MATPFGQESSAAAKALGTAFGQTYNSTKAPKAKSVKPSNVNKNIKVSQSEIDTIKKMGMSKALASAGSASTSMQEGIRRLYGERRYQAATYKPNNVSSSTTSNFTYSSPVGPRKVDSFRSGERTTPKAVTSPNRAGERSTTAKKVGKPKDTSFNKSGVSGVLKSPEAKKFRKAFAKKGLIPALRGK